MNITPDQARIIVEHAIRKGWATRPAHMLTPTEVRKIKMAQMRPMMRCHHCSRVMRSDSASWNDPCPFRQAGEPHEVDKAGPGYRCS